MVRDGRRFIQYCKPIVEDIPLQVYASGLVFSPSHCLTRRRFQREEPKWLIIKPTMGENWSACLQTFEGHRSSVWSVAWSPDGTRVATASSDKTIKIWDLATGQCETINGHSDWVYSVAWSPDGRQIASASHDCTVKIWDLVTGQCETLDGHSGPVYSVAWSPDGKQIASASDDCTR